MVCKNRDIRGLLTPSWVLITLPMPRLFPGVRINQDLIWCVEVGV